MLPAQQENKVLKTASSVFRNIFKKQVTEDWCSHKITKIQFHIPRPPTTWPLSCQGPPLICTRHVFMRARKAKGTWGCGKCHRSFIPIIIIHNI
jgi:hypothetical protein